MGKLSSAMAISVEEVPEKHLARIQLEMSVNGDSDYFESRFVLPSYPDQCFHISCKSLMLDSDHKFYEPGSIKYYNSFDLWLSGPLGLAEPMTVLQPPRAIWTHDESHQKILFSKVMDGEFDSWTADLYESTPVKCLFERTWIFWIDLSTSYVGQKFFTREFSETFEQLEYCDITFQLNDGQIRAHGSVFSKRSPVFAALIQKDVDEKVPNPVYRIRKTMDLFKGFLYYIYMGRLKSSLTCNQLIELYEAGEIYKMADLKKACVEELEWRITPENVFHLFKLTDRRRVPEVKESAFHFILNGLSIDKICQHKDWEAFVKEYPESTVIIIQKLSKSYQKVLRVGLVNNLSMNNVDSLTVVL